MRFADHFFLTNQADVVAPLLTADFGLAIGGVEFSFLQRSRAVVYAWLPDDLSLPNHDTAVHALTSALRTVDTYLVGLWMRKDHAITSELGFLHFRPTQRGVMTTASNALARRPSTAQGEYSPTQFSFSELRNIGVVFEGFLQPPVDPSEALGTSTRLERGRYYVDGARCSGPLPLKIAQYVTALEALLSTDAQELSHRLSERVALLLGTSGPERADLYRRMKRAYGVRSRVLHGDRPGRPGDTAFTEVSAAMDDVARRTLAKIPSIPALATGSNEAIDAYFLDLLFNSASEPAV